MVNPYDGDLTFVGSVLESLPISARLGRLLLLGYVFNCLEECLVIAAALSQRSIFTKPFDQEMQAYRYACTVVYEIYACVCVCVRVCRSKMNWADRSNSDCFAVLNAYKVSGLM